MTFGEMMSPTRLDARPADNPLLRWQLEMDKAQTTRFWKRVGHRGAPGGDMPSANRNVTKFLSERSRAQLRQWERERMRAQRQLYIEQYKAEGNRKEMEGWHDRWRHQTSKLLHKEVWAMEFGQDRWDADRRRQVAHEERRRVAAASRSSRRITALVREQELGACREALEAELAERARFWVTVETLDARIELALRNPVPLHAPGPAGVTLDKVRVAAPRMSIFAELEASDAGLPREDRAAALRADLESQVRLRGLDPEDVDAGETVEDLEAALAQFRPKREAYVPKWAGRR